jgi:S1-C subfamily serine protease
MTRTTTSRFALALGAALCIAPTSITEAQSRALANPDRVTPIASAGCSGLSWERIRTIDGAAYPVVTHVQGQSPADHGGVKEGDVIVAVNGRDARELEAWFVASPGEEVVLRVERAGKPRDIKVTAGRVLELAPEKLATQCVRY